MCKTSAAPEKLRSLGTVKAWRFFGVLENLTNKRYEDYIGFQSPGIALRFGVAYQN